jgi:hypothetical protein
VPPLRDRRDDLPALIADAPAQARPARHHAQLPDRRAFRYWFERSAGPLRQYIVTGNDEERPFSRDQRRWIYASAKKENNYFGFGTDNDLEQTPGYLIIRQRPFPSARRGRARVRPQLVRCRAPRCWAARAAQARLPPHLHRQHLGDELRLALSGRRRGDQPRA